jgi:ribonuclease HI
MIIDNLPDFFESISKDAEIIVYTDGACSGNPGPGGWGAVFLADNNQCLLNGGELNTTNNRMEMMAALAAMEQVIQNKPAAKLSLVTDSKYLKDGINLWMKNWKKNGWKTAAKTPVKNQDIWIKLDAATSQLNLTWQWIKGHSGDEYNDLADTLARKAIISYAVTG